jgi:hypothetical protein
MEWKKNKTNKQKIKYKKKDRKNNNFKVEISQGKSNTKGKTWKNSNTARK